MNQPIFSNARVDDAPEILELLQAVQLPHEGVMEHLSGFTIVRDDAGILVACAGVERHGDIGLLRSVAVVPGGQKTGLGTRLIESVLTQATQSGIVEMVLLTTTARDFFAGKHGFRVTSREPYQEKLAGSPEWQLPRCASAVVMKKDLAGG